MIRRSPLISYGLKTHFPKVQEIYKLIDEPYAIVPGNHIVQTSGVKAKLFPVLSLLVFHILKIRISQVLRQSDGLGYRQLRELGRGVVGLFVLFPGF